MRRRIVLQLWKVSLCLCHWHCPTFPQTYEDYLQRHGHSREFNNGYQQVKYKKCRTTTLHLSCLSGSAEGNMFSTLTFRARVAFSTTRQAPALAQAGEGRMRGWGLQRTSTSESLPSHLSSFHFTSQAVCHLDFVRLIVDLSAEAVSASGQHSVSWLRLSGCVWLTWLEKRGWGCTLSHFWSGCQILRLCHELVPETTRPTDGTGRVLWSGRKWQQLSGSQATWRSLNRNVMKEGNKESALSKVM